MASIVYRHDQQAIDFALMEERRRSLREMYEKLNMWWRVVGPGIRRPAHITLGGIRHVVVRERGGSWSLDVPGLPQKFDTLGELMRAVRQAKQAECDRIANLAANWAKPVRIEPMDKFPILDKCAVNIRDFISFGIEAIAVWETGFLTRRKGGAYWTLTAVRPDGAHHTERFEAEIFSLDKTAIDWLRAFCLKARIPFKEQGKMETQKIKGPRRYLNPFTGVHESTPVPRDEDGEPISRPHLSRPLRPRPLPPAKIKIKPFREPALELLAHIPVDYCQEVRRRWLEDMIRLNSQCFPGSLITRRPSAKPADAQQGKVLDFQAEAAKLARKLEDPVNLEVKPAAEAGSELTANQRAKLTAEAWWSVSGEDRQLELVAEPTIKGDRRTIHTYKFGHNYRRRSIAILTVTPEHVDEKLAAAEAYLASEIARLRAGQFGEAERDAVRAVRPWDLRDIDSVRQASGE